MKRSEFVWQLLRNGFDYWGKRGDYEVYGRITYEGGRTSLGTEAVDWEEWHVYKNRAEHYYGTNRSIPGWSMCPYCGSWYQHNEEEYHEDCEPEVVYFF